LINDARMILSLLIGWILMRLKGFLSSLILVGCPLGSAAFCLDGLCVRVTCFINERRFLCLANLLLNWNFGLVALCLDGLMGWLVTLILSYLIMRQNIKGRFLNIDLSWLFYKDRPYLLLEMEVSMLPSNKWYSQGSICQI